MFEEETTELEMRFSYDESDSETVQLLLGILNVPELWKKLNNTSVLVEVFDEEVEEGINPNELYGVLFTNEIKIQDIPGNTLFDLDAAIPEVIKKPAEEMML